MSTQSVQSALALRPRDAAKALGISPRLLWQLTHDGHIPCVRVGSGKRRTVLYPTADLQAWLSRQLAKRQTGLTPRYEEMVDRARRELTESIGARHSGQEANYVE
jgi:excisionase family DNA binding protein